MTITESYLRGNNIWLLPKEISRFEKISLFIYCFFQALTDLFSFNFSLFYWDCKNSSHLKKAPNFVVRRPSAFKLDNDLTELFEVYKKLVKVRDPIASMNDLLKKGCCHGEALAIVFSKKNDFRQDVTRFQSLEIFRYIFEIHERYDLLEKVNALLPQFKGEKEFNNLKEALATEGRSLLRIYNKTFSHTLILHVDQTKKIFSFYNPDSRGGLYSYSSSDQLQAALQDHLTRYTQNVRYHLSFC